MANKDEIEGVAEAVAAIVKAVPVYEDALQPVAQEAGKALKTLGGVINIALAPLAVMVYGYEVIKEELRNRLETRLAKIPPENIVSPPLQVVGPILEKYKFVHNSEDLSQMFINLLANAMDKDQVEKAHPSFVNIISELSPDEAKLIQMIKKEVALPKIDLIKKTKSNPDVESSGGYITIKNNFTVLGDKALLQHPTLTSSYLSNLERLMIIRISGGSMQDSYTNTALYKELEEHQEIKEIMATSTEEKTIEIVRGTIEITDFGEMFISAVL